MASATKRNNNSNPARHVSGYQPSRRVPQRTAPARRARLWPSNAQPVARHGGAGPLRSDGAFAAQQRTLPRAAARTGGGSVLTHGRHHQHAGRNPAAGGGVRRRRRSRRPGVPLRCAGNGPVPTRTQYRAAAAGAGASTVGIAGHEHPPSAAVVRAWRQQVTRPLQPRAELHWRARQPKGQLRADCTSAPARRRGGVVPSD